MRKRIIGVMGPRAASDHEAKMAYELGCLIAKNGWITLNGGMGMGVMNAASKGASENGGLTIGILPNNDAATWSEYLDIPIVTDMDEARNCINVLSSDVVVAVGMNPGTASEVALALRAKKPVVLLDPDNESVAFFKKLGKLKTSKTPEEAIAAIKTLI